MTDYRVVCDPAPTPADVLAEAVDKHAAKVNGYLTGDPFVPEHTAVRDALAAYRAWKKPAPRYVVVMDFTPNKSMPHEVWDCGVRSYSEMGAPVAAFSDLKAAERHAASLNEVKP